MEVFKIYEDEYFIVKQDDKYINVPGLYVITEKKVKWDSSTDSINNLAIIEKKIRDSMLDMGLELVGIYKEQSQDKGFKVIIIPYHLEVLNKLEINYDMYQPYISKYLDFFNNEYADRTNEINNIMKVKMNKV